MQEQRVNTPTQFRQAQLNEPANDSPLGVSEGDFRGQTVVQRDHPSMVSLAAKEMGEHASHLVNTSLGNRSVSGSGQKVSSNPDPDKADSDLSNTFAGLEKSEKAQTFFSILGKEGAKHPDQILKQAESYFKDVTQQFAVISKARENLQKSGEGDSPLGKALGEALDNLMKAKGAEIRAGLNVTKAAMSFSEQGLGEISELRDFYRNTVLKYEGFEKAYSQILNHFKDSNFRQGVDYLLRSVGMDLQSNGPSLSKPELKLIMDDLYNLEVLGNIHKDINVLFAKMQKVFRFKLAIGPQDLMGKLMGLMKTNWVKKTNVIRLPRMAGIPTLPASIFFLQHSQQMVSKFPLKIFQGANYRQNLLAAFQAAVDELVEEEKAIIKRREQANQRRQRISRRRRRANR